jgi:hypothetical protein
MCLLFHALQIRVRLTEMALRSVLVVGSIICLHYRRLSCAGAGGGVPKANGGIVEEQTRNRLLPDTAFAVVSNGRVYAMEGFILFQWNLQITSQTSS